MITCIEFLSLHSHCNGCIFNMELASLGMHGVNVIYDRFFLGHLSHSGDLLLWVGVRRRASSVVRRALTSSPQKLLGQS